MFAIIIGLCKDSMKHQVECPSKCKKAQQSRDVIGPLKMIEELACSFNSWQCLPLQTAHRCTPNNKRTKTLLLIVRDLSMWLKALRDDGPTKPIAIAEKNPSMMQKRKMQGLTGVTIKCLLARSWNKLTMNSNHQFVT